MKLRSLSLVFALATTAALTSACSGEAPAPQTSASALAKAPVATEAHGPVKLVGAALGEVALRPEQRSAIEKIAENADARHQVLAKTRHDLVKAFAEQVEKGSVDRAALAPQIERAAAEMKAAHPEDGKDLEKLHAILDAGQRDAFVDALEERMKEARKGHRGGGFGKLKELADAMTLTDEQKGKIKEAMRGAHEDRAHAGRWAKGAHHGRHGKQALESFRDDGFEAKALFPDGQHDGVGQAMAGRVLDAAEKILPLLTPAQRKIAADKLRAAADAGELPFGG